MQGWYVHRERLVRGCVCEPVPKELGCRMRQSITSSPSQPRVSRNVYVIDHSHKCGQFVGIGDTGGFDFVRFRGAKGTSRHGREQRAQVPGFNV